MQVSYRKQYTKYEAETIPSAAYHGIRVERRELGYHMERNDCSVFALTHLYKLSYGQAHDALKSYGRQDGDGVKLLAIQRAASALCPGVKIKSIPKPAKTVRSFKPDFNKLYLVYTCDHVLSIRNGMYSDGNPDSLQRITSVYEVTLPGQAEAVLPQETVITSKTKPPGSVSSVVIAKADELLAELKIVNKSTLLKLRKQVMKELPQVKATSASNILCQWQKRVLSEV